MMVCLKNERVENENKVNICLNIENSSQTHVNPFSRVIGRYFYFYNFLLGE
jgi:hypothetical protein